MMCRRHFYRARQAPTSLQGFSLLEVLVAIVVVAIGILGASMYAANGMAVASDSTMRALAVDAAAPLFDELATAARGGRDTLYAALAALDPDGDGVYERQVTTNAGRYPVTVRILRATDAMGQDVLHLSNSTLWQPPIEIGAQISYVGKDGQIRSLPYPMVVVMP